LQDLGKPLADVTAALVASKPLSTIAPRVRVFGDSLSDSGTFGLKFTVQGSAATGPGSSSIWVDVVAAQYQKKLLCPYFRITGSAVATESGCTNYAIGGGRINNFTDPGSPLSVVVQLQTAAQIHGAYTASDILLIDGGGNDAADLAATRHAMRAVGIGPGEQERIFSLLAALVHLADLEFAPCPVDGDDACALPEAGARALASAAALLGVEAGALLKAVTTRTRVTPDGPIVSPLGARAASDTRDALSKVIYARLFDWLVARINEAIGEDPVGGGARHPPFCGCSRGSWFWVVGGWVGGGRGGGGRGDAGTARGLGSPYSPPGGGRRAGPRLARPMKHSTCPDATPIAPPPFQTPTPKPPTPPQSRASTIGLLDIYGFESFDFNDLEQVWGGVGAD
jgi:hypothetical protein